MLEPFATEFRRYKSIVEKTLSQVDDKALNHVPISDGNSLAMLVRHLTGNLISRFTDFLTTDGEKPWRHRDTEFQERVYAREEVNEMWQRAWSVLEESLSALSVEDLSRVVIIRGQELTVHAALARSLAHISYHVGQMVLLARIEQKQEWEWISIPKGQSQQYNLNPTMERSPD